MADTNKLIDLEDLKVFKEKYDIEINTRLEDSGAELTKNSIVKALGYTPANVTDLGGIKVTNDSTFVTLD